MFFHTFVINTFNIENHQIHAELCAGFSFGGVEQDVCKGPWAMDLQTRFKSLQQDSPSESHQAVLIIMGACGRIVYKYI